MSSLRAFLLEPSVMPPIGICERRMGPLELTWRTVSEVAIRTLPVAAAAALCYFCLPAPFWYIALPIASINTGYLFSKMPRIFLQRQYVNEETPQNKTASIVPVWMQNAFETFCNALSDADRIIDLSLRVLFVFMVTALPLFLLPSPYGGIIAVFTFLGSASSSYELSMLDAPQYVLSPSLLPAQRALDPELQAHGLAGIENKRGHNLCWMNSCLQMCRNISAWRTALKEDENESPEQQAIRTFYQLYDDNLGSLARGTPALCQALGLPVGQQREAGEGMLRLLESIPGARVQSSARTVRIRHMDPAAGLDPVEQTRYNEELHEYLFPINLSALAQDVTTPIAFQQAYRLALQEKLKPGEMTLRIGSEQVSVSRTELKFLSAPESLFLQFSRFQTQYDPQTASLKQWKINNKITHISHRMFLPIWTEEMRDGHMAVTRNRSARYRIDSFIVHSGDLGGGHYVAYVLKNGQWYCCDDARVFRVDVPIERFLQDAYIVHYRKVPPHEAPQALQ